ncbi:MAG: hypothetical protein M0R06_03225 [Sphaerochaeta sp.]|jgi:hypothetical protein|nr:hypothetical protein [Sphaerochaeta sp.]
MSRFINGRTRRDVVTTNNLPVPEKVEPQGLNQITTGIIPEAKPKPAPVGDGFAKMITSNDESPDFGRDVDDMSQAEPMAAVKKPGRQKKSK